MFLFKRPNGIWYIGQDVSGKRKTLSTKTRNKSVALDFFRSYRNENKDVRIDDLKRVAVQYAELNTGVKTQSAYKSTLTIFSKFLANEKLINVSYTDIQNYIASRKQTDSVKGKPFSLYWINFEIAILKKSFSIAQDKKWISDNPMIKVKKFTVKSDVPAFTDEELTLFLSEFAKRENPHYLYAVKLALITGMRRGEICRLKWEQIGDWKIQLQNKITKEIEYAYFNDEALAIFNTLKQSKVKSSEGYIWGKVLAESYLSNIFRKCIKRLGLNPKLRFHSTRHTAITGWANTHNLHIAQDLARHATPDMTKKYIDTRSKELQDAIRGVK